MTFLPFPFLSFFVLLFLLFLSSSFSLPLVSSASLTPPFPLPATYSFSPSILQSNRLLAYSIRSPSLLPADSAVPYTTNQAAIWNTGLDILSRNCDGLLEKINKLKSASISGVAYSVMNKNGAAPNTENNKHYYYSLSPYWWDCRYDDGTGIPPPADCNITSGLPYKQLDGQVNPLAAQTSTDSAQYLEMVNAVESFSLCYYFLTPVQEKYAAAAVNLISDWFLNPATSMLPNVQYGEVRTGMNNDEGSAEGIIQFKNQIILIDSMALLTGSTAYSTEFQSQMKTWFTDYLDWLVNSPQGTVEKDSQNNHASWYAVQTATIQLYLGKIEDVVGVLEDFKNRIMVDQIDATTGALPAEVRRTDSFHYTCFALESYLRFATLIESARQLSVFDPNNSPTDLFTYATPTGQSLKLALQYINDYIDPVNKAKKNSWPHTDLTVRIVDYSKCNPFSRCSTGISKTLHLCDDVESNVSINCVSTPSMAYTSFRYF